MLKRLDRTVKQSFDDIEREFDGCHVLVRMEKSPDDSGYLVAVSEEPETLKDMCAIMQEFDDSTLFYTGGFYKNGFAIGLQNIID